MDDRRLDALVSPTLPATASPMSESEHVYGDLAEHISVSYVRTTAPFNLSGQPTISVPCGFDRDGLPIGLQIATRSGTDALTLAIAHAFEATRSMDDRVPQVSVWSPSPHTGVTA